MNIEEDVGMNIFDRIRLYTRPTQDDLLRAEYQLRQSIQYEIRELRRIAAEIEQVADELEATL